MPNKILTPLLYSANQKGIGTADFTVCLKREIGRGTQGRVLEAVLNYPGSKNYRCAAKHTFFTKESKLDQEKNIHQLITNPDIRSKECSILRHIGSVKHFDKNKELSLSLTPLCDMTLSDCINDIVNLKSTNAPLYKLLAFSFLESMINGLSHLAQYKIIHCDLKPDNIGFYETWCLFDFGSSKTYECFATSPVQGSYLYIAPEIAFGDMRFPEAGDIWSLGQILRQLSGMELVTFLEQDQELQTATLAWAKSDAYSKVKDREAPKDLISYQINLRHDICSLTSFMECLNFLIECMTHTSPSLRPNLETLKFAIEHLNSFQREYASIKDKAEFYELMIKKYGVQMTDNSRSPNREPSTFNNIDISPDADDSSVYSISPTIPTP